MYIKQEHHPFLKEVSSQEIPCGLFGVLGNKGAVTVYISLYDSFFCFVNAHLAADTYMIDRRNQDFREISQRILFKHSLSYRFHQKYPWVWNMDHQKNHLNNDRDGLTQFDSDYLIWLGDFNYRLNIENEEVRKCIQSNRYNDLLEYDQLIQEMKSWNVFNHFKEGPIHFMPTYKYDNGTSNYDSR